MTTRRLVLIGLGSAALLAPTAARAAPCCGAISAEGERLASALDRSGVERLWPAGWHVNWRTGEPDRAEPHGPDAHTHCSAFVAAMAERFGVYVLRPPEHPQQLLANAQMKWLETDGAGRGWHRLANARTAQDRANRGELVVASFRNPDARRPGHIAIVRPSLKSAAELERDGPQVTQAGTHNWLSTTMRRGFAGHPGAWALGGTGAAAFFAHAIEHWPQA